MAVHKSCSGNSSSFDGCPMPDKFDLSHCRYLKNLAKVARRYASIASKPNSTENVVVNLDSVSAKSSAPDFPSLEVFGGSSTCSFPDFSFLSAGAKGSFFEGSAPCNEQPEICISRCNSSRWATSMVEKSSVPPPQRRITRYETILEKDLDEGRAERRSSKNGSVHSSACPAGNTAQVQKHSKASKPTENGKDVTKMRNDSTMALPSNESERPSDSEVNEVEPAKSQSVPSGSWSEMESQAAINAAPLVKNKDINARKALADKQTKKEAVKMNLSQSGRTVRLRFETFPRIVRDAVEVPVPCESMLCEPRRKIEGHQISPEEDAVRLGYLLEHLRLTEDRVQLWLDLHGERYRQRKA